MRNRITVIVLAVLLTGLLAACQAPAESTQPVASETSAVQPTDTSVPTETPVPTRTLTVCLTEEPKTLYAYGDSSRSMWDVLEAIYDGPYDTRSYSTQPVILEKLPSLADGDAQLQAVSVSAGDPVVDSSGQLVALAKGVSVFPAGCRANDCAQTWDGASALQMDQLSVTFKVKAGVQWSDGVAVTAGDSVYSFNVAADPATPSSKDVIDRTASYTALDDQTVQWVGVPGFIEQRYPTFFFLPLPQHTLQSLTPAQLASDETVARQPMGWGPYMLQEWVAGDHILLKKNANYFRAAEGLPHFDFLEYRFIGDPADGALMALVNGQCDIVDQNDGFLPMLEELINTENNGRLTLYLAQGPEWEHLDFGIRPASYDDGYDLTTGDRADLFGDVRTRQAFAACIDREGMVNELFHNRSSVPLGYLPPSHPLYQADLPSYSYDPQAGVQLLDQVGWKDADGNPATPRVAAGVTGVPDGTPLLVSLDTTTAGLRQEVARQIAEDLTQCGVGVTTSLDEPGNLFAPGPDGKLFGRSFDLATFYWESSALTPCLLYTSGQIPSAANHWVGANVTGFSDADYDAACEAAYWSMPDQSDYTAVNQAAERLFSQDLPVIPLYYQLKIAISRPDLCGLDLDLTARSLLSNLELLDEGEGCAQ
jgi:peptide/nickel transport system substrate-binding protein